ncbi:Apoptotic chromatin condensation inducer in the nucleus [Zostera marina]|uniref:Apoptotic chromatin condensation inducer in the nucleus n=1 Tax=Zostera marina TaxID=29655 RepID=A0A0K9PIS0_ZOSMR|nr:Apoptotic chromatin condensation inducer in the nucleus [Zostera marina]
MSSPYPVLNNRPIDHWKVTELKEELRKRKLTIKGLKEDLVKRLRDAIYEEIDELKRQELNNVSNQESNQKDRYVEDLPNSMGSGLIDVLRTGNQSTNIESDTKKSDIESDKNTSNDCEGNKAPAKEFVTTADLNTSLEEECPAVPMKSDVLSGLASETETYQHPVCVETTDVKADQGMDDKNKELKSVTEDFTLNQSELKNQVSEVELNLGLQVNCESISIDSVSINEKNELKDNLNADNFHLELEVVKTELVHSSSTDVAPIGGDLHPSDNVPDPGDNQVPDEIMVDVLKTDNVDVGYSEKLNLDRSSGDESIEEDVLESKQIQSNAVPEVVEGRIDLEVVHSVSSELSPPKDNVIAHDAEKPFIPSEKRKHEEKEPHGGNEPFKRQRRWVTESQRVHEQHVSNLTSLDTPINSCSFTPKHTFVRSDSNISREGDTQKERTVPLSLKPPTNSLRIDRFLRPFTLKAAQELLGKTGTVCSFWMDTIKTHCYVTYSSEEEAVETRNAIYNLQWPPNGGRLLVAEFVDPQEVKKHLEAPLDSPLPMSSPASISPTTQVNQLSRQKSLKKQLPPPPSLPVAPPSKERLAPSPISKEPEPPLLTLDELFMKTKSTPRIYYLPLTEEQVSAKKVTQVRD